MSAKTGRQHAKPLGLILSTPGTFPLRNLLTMSEIFGGDIGEASPVPSISASVTEVMLFECSLIPGNTSSQGQHTIKLNI